MIELDIKTIIRFLKKIEVKGSCWEWTASKFTDGYGSFNLKGKIKGAHRISYELFKEKISKDLTVDHLCRNRKCVNPNHLEAVTNQENCRRGLTGYNNAQIKRTHCPKGHPLAEPNLLKFGIKKGWRQCKQCHYEWQHEYTKKRKEVYKPR